MTTAEVRRNFLIDGLFTKGAVELVYTGLDRLIAGGIMPDRELELPAGKELASSYFTERREIGIINIGDAGEVQVGSTTFSIGPLECLYIGAGQPNVVFRNVDSGQAAFYLLSAPAHRSYPTRMASLSDATVLQIGSAHSASRRKLVQYIHEDGIESCQLVMGFTSMEEGSVWNTWPPHTHLRRSGGLSVFRFRRKSGNPSCRRSYRIPSLSRTR